MRWSRTFIPTLRDHPADPESLSQHLLIRAAFIRLLPSGTWSYLPLGQRTMLRIIDIVRGEMSAAGAQEFWLPTFGPAESGQESRRRSGERANPNSHEDLTASAPVPSLDFEAAFSEIARGEIRSYKQLPQLWYRIGQRPRDDRGPKSGPLRAQQCISADLCSFDADRKGLDRSYDVNLDACLRIFARCNLMCTTAEAGTGAAADLRSRKFMVPRDAGRDLLVFCACGYAAHMDCATSRLPELVDHEATGEPQEVYTPDRKTIAEVADFLQVPPNHQIKSLVYVADGKPCLFLLRGDHQLNEAKAAAALDGAQLRTARQEEIFAAFGAEAGSLGPLGISGIAVYSDLALKGRHNLVCGANRNDYHLRGVTPDLHFKPVWKDLRAVERGEACVRCGSPLDVLPAAVLGRVSQLGAGKSAYTGAVVLTAEGKQTPILVSSCGIDLEMIMASAVELYHDPDGIIWPASIAPFSAIITPVNYRDDVRSAADRLYADLEEAGVDTLLDDREERPGVKFKDADLTGIPFRIVLGPEKVKQGRAELFIRASKTTEVLDLDSLIPVIRSKLKTLQPGPKPPPGHQDGME